MNIIVVNSQLANIARDYDMTMTRQSNSSLQNVNASDEGEYNVCICGKFFL